MRGLQAATAASLHQRPRSRSGTGTREEAHTELLVRQECLDCALKTKCDQLTSPVSPHGLLKWPTPRSEVRPASICEGKGHPRGHEVNVKDQTNGGRGRWEGLNERNQAADRVNLKESASWSVRSVLFFVGKIVLSIQFP